LLSLNGALLKDCGTLPQQINGGSTGHVNSSDDVSIFSMENFWYIKLI